MNTEKLISKGVKKHFNGQVVLFNVESLKEHFDGLLIHESDIINISESEDEQSVQYVKIGDVNFDNATAIEVEPQSEATPVVGMSYEEAEELLKIGELIALPEWGGFWFGNIKTGEVLVLTKDGEITNTPFEEFKERKDWIKVEASPEQKELLDNYFQSLEAPVETVDAEEPIEEIVPEPIAETPAPKTKKTTKK